MRGVQCTDAAVAGSAHTSQITAGRAVRAEQFAEPRVFPDAVHVRRIQGWSEEDPS